MGIADLFFSFQGRIGRTRFWTASLVNLATFGLIALALVVASGRSEEGASSGLVFAVFAGFAAFKYVDFAICAKRWHDRGKSGWWSMIAFAPLIGPFWLLIEAGLVRGQEGPNEYGPDPRGGDREAASFRLDRALAAPTQALERRGGAPEPAPAARSADARRSPAPAVRLGGRPAFGRRGS